MVTGRGGSDSDLRIVLSSPPIDVVKVDKDNTDGDDDNQYNNTLTKSRLTT